MAPFNKLSGVFYFTPMKSPNSLPFIFSSALRVVIITLLTQITFTACTSTVLVKRIVDPEIELDSPIQTFAFASAFDTSEINLNKSNQELVTVQGSNQLIEGVIEGFNSNEDYNLKPLDTLIEGHAYERNPALMPAEIITDLCSIAKTDAVLILEGYEAFLDKEVEVEEKDDGSKERTAYYDLVIGGYFTIYDNSGVSLIRTVASERIAYDSRGVISGLLAFGPSVKKTAPKVNQVSKELGMRFVHKFYPDTLFIPRNYYSGKPFQSVKHDFKNRDWNSAEEKLIEFAKSSDPKIKGKAAYNLSIVYQALQKNRESEMWYAEAERLLGASAISGMSFNE